MPQNNGVNDNGRKQCDRVYRPVGPDDSARIHWSPLCALLQPVGIIILQ